MLGDKKPKTEDEVSWEVYFADQEASKARERNRQLADDLSKLLEGTEYDVRSFQSCSNLEIWAGQGGYFLCEIPPALCTKGELLAYIAAAKE